MNVKSREQRLSDLLKSELVREPEMIDSLLYRRSQVRVGSVLCSLSQRARTRALHAYFVQHNIDASKQNFYLATKLTLASIGQDGGAVFEITTDFLYALLSDNADVINAIAHVEVPQLVRNRNNPLNSRFRVHMWQLAIRGEYDELRLKIRMLAEHGRKRERVESAAGADYFSLLMKREAAALEKLISRRKNADDFFGDFLDQQATMEAKLCWLKGIPVRVDGPLVPMELMPVKPLTHYDDVYDFLKPGWEAPRQGLLGKVSRWTLNKSGSGI